MDLANRHTMRRNGPCVPLRGVTPHSAAGTPWWNSPYAGLTGLEPVAVQAAVANPLVPSRCQARKIYAEEGMCDIEPRSGRVFSLVVL